jgi:hypothetical protein
MQHRIARFPLACLLAAYALPAALALLPAAALADRLVMNNGDTITGDISAIGGGKVTIQPAYSDAFAVNLADVASIEADTVYEVVLEDGRKVEARFAGAAADQQTLIVEEQPLAIGITDIATAAPPPPYSEGVSQSI